LQAERVTDAFGMAVGRRHVEPGIVFHGRRWCCGSGRGCRVAWTRHALPHAEVRGWRAVRVDRRARLVVLKPRPAKERTGQPIGRSRRRGAAGGSSVLPRSEKGSCSPQEPSLLVHPQVRGRRRRERQTHEPRRCRPSSIHTIRRPGISAQAGKSRHHLYIVVVCVANLVGVRASEHPRVCDT
jgi:hypothetical protein